jgi:hypothetical protein
VFPVIEALLAVISPTHKRTEGRAPVWGSEFTSKDAALQGVGEIAARLKVKLCDLVTDCLRGGGISPLFLPNPPHTEIKSRHGN